MSRVTGDGEGPLVYLIAGEPSGDLLGARLMAALKRRSGGRIRFAGVGGDGMAREGLDSLIPMAELSIMGFAEIAPRLLTLIRHGYRVVDAIRAQRPDAVVTIDFSGFNFRVAKRVRDLGIPLIHYVAPSVWAYFPGRARKVAKFLDHIMALLPFEPPFFEAEGLPCSWVGHPVVEEGDRRGDGAGFRARHGIPPEAPLIAVLPGSRRMEVSRLLPYFREALTRLVARFPDLHAVAPTVSTVAERVRADSRTWPVPTVVTEDAGEKYDAFAACDAALAASGTVSVELAACGVPHVVAYKASPLTSVFIPYFALVDHASLVNLVMERRVVPEFLNRKCRADGLADAVGLLLADPEAAATQREDLRRALARLGQGGEAPSARAADVVLALIAEHRIAAEGKTERETSHG